LLLPSVLASLAGFDLKVWHPLILPHLNCEAGESQGENA